MRKNKKKQTSLVSAFTNSYLIFTVAAFLVLIGFILVATYIFSQNRPSSYDNDLSSYEGLLRKENYQAFPTEELLGKEGEFAVFDSQGQRLYKSDNSEQPSYSPFELELMSSIEGTGEISLEIDTLTNNQDEKVYVYQKVLYLDNSLDNTYKQALLFKEDGTVLSGNFKNQPQKLNQLEKDIILKHTIIEEEDDSSSSNTPDDFYLMTYDFKNQSGEKRSLVLKSSIEHLHQEQQKSIVFMVLVILLFIGLYLGVALLFARRLRNRVKKPIDVLNQAILGLADSKQQITDYQNPREFVPIIDNFNKVSHQLRVSEQRQEELTAERQKMMADISHDLKTPVTVIQGYVSAIKDGLISPEQAEKYLDIIYQKTEKITGLIDSFHEFSKLEHPEFKLQKTKIDFVEFIRSYLAHAYTEFELSGYTLEADIPEYPLFCEVDSSLFKRALDNLLANFFNYNPVGSTLFVAISSNENQLQLRIADDGVGIDEALAAQLFKPFVTGDGARSMSSGTGLGLTIVQHIIEKHGGTIKLEKNTESAYKTVFLIQLPLV